MRAELALPLTLEFVRAAPVDYLLAALKTWLSNTNPICLVHPHGFFVVPVNRTDVGDWRFHFWARGKRTIRGMPAFIHTHDRHVDSRILLGQLTNTTYKVCPSTTGGLPLYEVGYSGDRYSKSTSNFLLKTPTRVEPRPISTETFAAGEFYHVDRHTYHEALVSEDDCTATLGWLHSRTPGPVNVVGCDGYPDRIEFNRIDYAGADLAKLLPVR